jgi:hypothetical protein
MKTTARTNRLAALALIAAAALLALPDIARAHCDGLDGPVVKAAQRALAEGNVNLVLIWAQKEDEVELRHAFEKTLLVRSLNAEARDLADRYFFETLVRIHRAGEGAPYTGLKPANRNLGPAIPAGDKAIETGTIEPVAKLLSRSMEDGLRTHFNTTFSKMKFDKNDVESGRAFVKAYVEYIHYVERLHEAANTTAHGHFPSSPSTEGKTTHEYDSHRQDLPQK